MKKVYLLFFMLFLVGFSFNFSFGALENITFDQVINGKYKEISITRATYEDIKDDYKETYKKADNIKKKQLKEEFKSIEKPKYRNMEKIIDLKQNKVLQDDEKRLKNKIKLADKNKNINYKDILIKEDLVAIRSENYNLSKDTNNMTGYVSFFVGTENLSKRYDVYHYTNFTDDRTEIKTKGYVLYENLTA